MTSRTKALIKPDLLVWARNSAGFTVFEAAQKLAISETKLAGLGRLAMIHPLSLSSARLRHFITARWPSFTFNEELAATRQNSPESQSRLE